MPIEEMEITEEEKQLMQPEEEAVETPVETPVPEVKEEPKAEVKPEVKEPVKEPVADPKTNEIITNLQKALKESRHEYREKIDKFQNEFLEFKNKFTQEQAPKPPDPEEDPLGHVQHQIKTVTEQQKATQDQIKQQEEVTRNQQFAFHVKTLEDNFRTQAKDYDAAFSFLNEFKRQELAEFGVTDQAIIDRELQTASVNIARVALQQGKNPAEVVYNLAKRYGYQAPKAEAPLKQAADHIATIEKGQQAAKTLKGEDVDSDVSFQALLKADGAEFDKLWKEKFDS